ncbi:MAG: sulfotransferase [Verrucomicrobia bacterium]|nr:sulfotransferase [Verrucomicrobiota bacterium]MBI3867254.1 sulfotransferase [Verrucomicrobiota bacterium]
MKPIEVKKLLQQARALLHSRQFAAAIALYQRVVQAVPGDGAVWFEYGSAASGAQDLALAEQAWGKALEAAPKNAELIGMIGHRYQGLRRTEKARECYARAAAADPGAINPRISLAVLMEQCHRLDDARAAVAECLRIDSRDDQARYFGAVLDRREGRLEEAETRLRDLILSEPRHPYVRYASRYELAQVLDRTDRCEEAMKMLAEAKALVRAITDAGALIRGYDQGAERARRFAERFPKDILRTWATYFPVAKREPVPPLAFLGGHPRSGTTLLEQILGAHPGVAAFDESPAFLDVLQPAFHASSDLSSQRINTLRRLYTRTLLRELEVPPAGRLLLDKNPSPTARMPLWLRVFPELRVLIALRDPRDVVLSCYFQNIPLNAVNVNFLAFDRLAKHYADLMDIWLTVREWEGFAWIETRYEDTVADLQKEGRRVTEFLGLTWHDDQNVFFEKSREKQFYSPTYQDVTRPIYTRSVARWQMYERHLAPILPALEPYCRRFGYAV